MKTTRIAIVTMALALASAGLWSCKKNDKPADRPAAGEQKDEEKERPSERRAMQDDEREEMMEHMRAACPVLVQDVEVEMTEIESGVALTFTTKSGDVEDLRQRVQRLARLYETHREHDHIRWHHMDERGQDERGQMGKREHEMNQDGERGVSMPAVKTSVVNVEHGARLELMPTNSDQVERLRVHVRHHHEHLQGGKCWMIRHGQETQRSYGE